MLQVMQKLLIVVLVGLLVSCANEPTSKSVGGVLGGIAGAVLGDKLADTMGLSGPVRTVVVTGVAGLGVIAGISIGGELAKYFGENDRKNLVEVLNKDTSQPQKTAWCSDKEAKPQNYITPTRNVRAVQCGSGNKIIQSVGVGKLIKTSEGEQVCKTSNTEVSNSGNPETISTTLCKKSDGTWYEKTT